MTRAEIIAELRRSAFEDGNCYSIKWIAFWEALDMRGTEEPNFSYMREDEWRTFYLLVAQALEDE